jgi:aryl-alcohol dehydrogenase-like predicted oxidoreductase
VGLTFVDTADIYSLGRSEELIGQALIGRREGVVLATKVRQPMGEGPYDSGLSRRWIVRAVEDSLKRLQTDYIDLYQAHAPDRDTPLDETLRAMDDLVHEGKVRYLGCSNYQSWEVVYGVGISRGAGLSPWVSVQQRWNLLEGLDDTNLLPACRELGLGIIPYTPLASGVLTGKYRKGEEPAPGTRMGDNPRMRSRLSDERLDLVERLRDWAEARGHTVAELAVAYLLAHEQVATVIVGARTPEQVEANVRLGEWRLTPGERDEVEALVS